VFPHLDHEGFAAVGYLFPPCNLISNVFDAGGEHAISGSTETGVNRREMAEKFGNIMQVAQDGNHFYRLTEHRVAHSQVNSVKGKLPITARLGHMCKVQSPVSFRS
jgi:hypothetical protein